MVDHATNFPGRIGTECSPPTLGLVCKELKSAIQEVKQQNLEVQQTLEKAMADAEARLETRLQELSSTLSKPADENSTGEVGLTGVKMQLSSLQDWGAPFIRTAWRLPWMIPRHS